MEYYPNSNDDNDEIAEALPMIRVLRDAILTARTIGFGDNGDDIGFVKIDFAQRPVITPASGVNESVQHQIWVDIFRLEQEQLANPSEQGLTQLSVLTKSPVCHDWLLFRVLRYH